MKFLLRSGLKSIQFVEDAVEVGVAGEDGEDVADVHADAFVVGRGV